MMGDYNVSGTRSKVIWTIGESWPIGNMYGLAYEYNGSYGHHLALKNNGSTYHRISFSSQGANFSGIVYANSSSRSPIFYDNNNTGYYFDGASINSTRMEGVSSRTKAHMMLSGQTRSSAEYYGARPRITGDTNYWTGAVGWGRQDFNTVANWGSGFFDTWSNPGSQPSGTSHWVGVQAYHYTNGGSRYGWQMCGGPITNLRFRSTWGGFRSWRTIPILDENSGSGGSMYAARYYDSNSTTWYVDPASTSQFSAARFHSWIQSGTNGSDSNPGLNLAVGHDITFKNSTYSSQSRILFENYDAGGEQSLRISASAYNTGGYTLSLVINNRPWWRGYVGVLRTPQYPLDVSGRARLSGGYTTSDRRLKENIRDNDLGLTELLQLRTRRFDWITGVELMGRTLQPERGLIDNRGFIAQEVEAVSSALVETNDEQEGADGVKSIDDGALTAMLVKSIQEQQVIIDDLKARLEVLEG
jgi:hypothetical protein